MFYSKNLKQKKMKSFKVYTWKFSELILISCGFLLVYFFYYVNNKFDSQTNKPIKSIISHMDKFTCEQSQDWLELNANIFLKKTSVKYFFNERKLVVLFTCRNGSYNDLLNIILNNCSLNYEKQMMHKFKSEQTKLDMFFNIRHYQNFLLTAYFNLKMTRNKGLNLVCGTRGIDVKIHHINERNEKKTAVICTEPLFLENQDQQSLAWWIEMNKLSGYKKIILFNNSIPNTRGFERLFNENKHFVEINQLKCLPNFFNSNSSKYLTLYKEFITGEWSGENIHFLAFDGITNNECLYANAHESRLVLIQDNDEAFVVPRLEKFSKLTSVVEFMSESKNRYKLNNYLYPKRSDCRTVKSNYFNDLFNRKLNANESGKYSVFFQNVVFAKNDLIRLIFKQLSFINFSSEYNFDSPLRIKIREKFISNDPMYNNSKYGANFVLTISNANEINYARNLLEIYKNLIEPFLNKTSGKVYSQVPENFKRFYFFKTPLVQPQYGKSLINIETATHSDPHRPNGKVVELNEYYMSHFRTRAIFERKNVPITSVIFDFNYFYCYFQPIFESLANKRVFSH